ncbi:MAG: hypothetical protein ACFFAH_14370 [Promethearchaeota archaeon]
MQIISQKHQEKIKNICDRCGKEINNAHLNKVIKITYGNIKKNTFSGEKVRYYHVECIMN